MFIKELCPRCDNPLHITSGGRFTNCFFCEGYSYRQAIRHEWFLEETRRSLKKSKERAIGIL